MSLRWVADRLRSVGRAEYPAVSAAVEWELVGTLYGQRASFVSSLAAMLVTGGIAWLRLGNWLPVGWTAAATLVAALRLLDISAFQRRAGTDTPQRWARRFLIGAWTQGALWGAASLVLLTTDDAFTQFVVITVQTGFLAGAAARNNAVPTVALGQVYCTLLPLLAVCLLHPSHYYLLYAVVVVLEIAASVATVRYLHRQAAGLLMTSEQNVALLASLGAANTQLEAANARLQSLATTDGLTGVVNRRGLDAALDAEWSRISRDATHLAVLLVDIDFFKAYNDRFGHQAGDDCLRRVARCLSATVRRPSDLVARYGGEEFAVILPGTDHFGAIDMAERLRAAVQAMALPHPDNPGGIVTISVGAATLHASGSAATVPEELIALADKELYRAKQAGRNRVRCAA